MQDFETICFENRADWLRLLAAYAQSEELAAQAEAAAAKQSAKQAAKAATAPVPVAAPAVFAESTIGNNDTDGEESATGWVSRISLLDGVEAAALSTLHGRLIALGYLKFKLIDRQIGLRYRLTPAGKQMAQCRPDETLTAAA